MVNTPKNPQTDPMLNLKKMINFKFFSIKIVSNLRILIYL